MSLAKPTVELALVIETWGKETSVEEISILRHNLKAWKLELQSVEINSNDESQAWKEMLTIMHTFRQKKKVE